MRILGRLAVASAATAAVLFLAPAANAAPLGGLPSLGPVSAIANQVLGGLTGGLTGGAKPGANAGVPSGVQGLAGLGG
ncbi:MAG: hypothetical protein HOV94_02670 [Saccharothrix sp.]|nr:hypothetical protein [Saccharothrix sp.]